MKALVCILLTLIACHVEALQIYDDFSTPNWISFNTTGVNVYEQQGKLKIDFLGTAKGATLGGQQGVITGGYGSTCRLEGDFDVAVDWSTPLLPFAHGVRVGFAVSDGPLWLSDGGASMVGMVVRSTDIETGDGYISSILERSSGNYRYTTDKAGRFRIKRVGLTLSVYFWDKVALKWTLAGYSSFTSNPVYMYLSSWSYDGLFGDGLFRRSQVQVKTTFDNVRITSGVCAKPS
jgi:hypothetical protein